VTPHAVGVLDTNAVILLERLRPSELPREPLITTISLAELSAGPLAARESAEAEARQARLQEAEAAFDPLAFDAPAARVFGRVAAALRRGGRQIKPRAFDALIASTAIANGLPVYTCNPRDFNDIEGLELVSIPHPDNRG